MNLLLFLWVICLPLVVCVCSFSASGYQTCVFSLYSYLLSSPHNRLWLPTGFSRWIFSLRSQFVFPIFLLVPCTRTGTCVFSPCTRSGTYAFPVYLFYFRSVSFSHLGLFPVVYSGPHFGFIYFLMCILCFCYHFLAPFHCYFRFRFSLSFSVSVSSSISFIFFLHVQFYFHFPFPFFRSHFHNFCVGLSFSTCFVRSMFIFSNFGTYFQNKHQNRYLRTVGVFPSANDCCCTNLSFVTVHYQSLVKLLY